MAADFDRQTAAGLKVGNDPIFETSLVAAWALLLPAAMDTEFRAPAEPGQNQRNPRDARREPDPLKGAIAGFVGGLVGTWFMSEYQGMWSKWIDGAEPQSAGGRHDARDWEEKNEDDNANEQAAQAVARRTVGRELTERELEVAAPLVHYAFGGSVSAAYGIFAEHAPWASGGVGTGFGTLVWVGADEIAMPVIGWSKPQRYPLRDHLQSFTSHLVFGLTTELARRGVRRLLR